MDLLEGLVTRRAVRQYTDQPIPDDLITSILEVGMMAPSAGNARPWHVIVVDQQDIKDQIGREHRFARMVPNCACALLICADRTLEKYPGFWVQDCSALALNTMLAAHAKGIGSVWIGIHPQPDRVQMCRDVFLLPETIEPMGLISMGWPMRIPATHSRYQSERVHHNVWDESWTPEL